MCSRAINAVGKLHASALRRADPCEPAREVTSSEFGVLTNEQLSGLCPAWLLAANNRFYLHGWVLYLLISDREAGTAAEQQGRAAVRRAPPVTPPGAPAGPTRGAPHPREAEASCGPAEATDASGSCATSAPAPVHPAAGAACDASACA